MNECTHCEVAGYCQQTDAYSKRRCQEHHSELRQKAAYPSLTGNLYNDVSNIVDMEIARFFKKHGEFHSQHEAYAVILERFESAENDVDVAKDTLKCFWNCIKKGVAFSGEPGALYHKSLVASMALIQMAAVAMKLAGAEVQT